jgi:threonine/homoserine/homoserine lactone efflux protein
VPFVAVILRWGTPRARANGSAFAVGWVAGLVVVSVVVLLVASGSDDGDSGTSTAVDVVKLLFGVLMLGLAAKQFQGRPRKGAEPEMPRWMAAIDGFTAGRSLGLGGLLSGVNPKNLALTLAAAATIAQAGLDAGGDAAAIAVFVVIASLTVVGPVLAYLLLGDRAAAPLGSIKEWMADNNAVIMTVVLLVLGAKLVGQGLGGLL